MTTITAETIKTAAASPEQLADLLEKQYNVISRSQALKYGITEDAIHHKLKRGSWQRIVPGVYSTVTGLITVDQRHMAALLYAGEDAVITGSHAVRRHHLTCPGGNDVDVLVPESTRVKSYGYIRIQRTQRMPSAVFATKGIRFAPLARAVGDAARLMVKPEDARALVCEAVQKGRCTVEDLIADLKAGPTIGSALFRGALKELSDGIRSEAERDLKVRIDRSDLEKPMYNARLFLPDGTFLGMVDTWWQRAGVAGEVDSRQYHMSARDYSKTQARHNKIEAAGVHMLHFLPMDIKRDWPSIYMNIRDAISSGKRNPPLQIIAVPPDVKDIKAYLMTKSSE